MSEFIAGSVGVVAFDPLSRKGSFVLSVEDRKSWPVTVTRRGLLSVASPPRATAERFLECIQIFRDIALDKCPDANLARPLELTAEDVRRWRRRHAASASDWGNGQ
ncbi:hypothetical protein ATY79_12030 [Rhizobium sp. R693]|nr:hypothetical protein ATY79_12030 [Rhizobium sp. R693]